MTREERQQRARELYTKGINFDECADCQGEGCTCCEGGARCYTDEEIDELMYGLPGEIAEYLWRKQEEFRFDVFHHYALRVLNDEAAKFCEARGRIFSYEEIAELKEVYMKNLDTHCKKLAVNILQEAMATDFWQ